MRKTIIILAGGKGQRFQSRDKCFIMFNDKLLIQYAIGNLSRMADELIVAARDERQGEQILNTLTTCKVVLVFDHLKGFGPLAGILAGLERASSSYSLIVGCDMPLVNGEVVDLLFEVAERGNYDAVVPQWENGMVEPLHAVYKREPMLAAVLGGIERKEKKIFKVLSQLKNVKFVPVNELRGRDPELTTFRNINTPEELKKLRITG